MAYDNDDIAFLDYFTALAPLDEEERENERKRAIIEEMRGASTRPLQGRRAGRTYVAPSPFEGFAQLGQAYIARKGGQKAYAKEEELADKRSTAMGGLRAALLGLDEEEELYNPYFRGSSRSV
tara:strand:- start:897 stop:1265 length:369 start_codon:yes stop_codon:yes gene_type:complete